MRYKQINNPHDGSLLDVNDRVGIVICAVGRQNTILFSLFYHFAYVRAQLDLDFWMQYATKSSQQEEFTRGK